MLPEEICPGHHGPSFVGNDVIPVHLIFLLCAFASMGSLNVQSDNVNSLFGVHFLLALRDWLLMARGLGSNQQVVYVQGLAVSTLCFVINKFFNSLKCSLIVVDGLLLSPRDKLRLIVEHFGMTILVHSEVIRNGTVLGVHQDESVEVALFSFHSLSGNIVLIRLRA